jgi:hypothetical protein
MTCRGTCGLKFANFEDLWVRGMGMGESSVLYLILQLANSAEGEYGIADIVDQTKIPHILGRRAIIFQKDQVVSAS